MRREEPESLRLESELPGATDDNPDAWLDRLKRGMDLPEREFQLYVRYLRALALLCECAPYVDEDDYVELIDELLVDACAHYPIDVYQDGHDRQIAPRTAQPPRSDSPAPPRQDQKFVPDPT